MGRLNCTKHTATVHTPRGVIRASAGDDVSSENGQERPIQEALPHACGKPALDLIIVQGSARRGRRHCACSTATQPRGQPGTRFRSGPALCHYAFDFSLLDDVGQGLIDDVPRSAMAGREPSP